MIAKLHSQRIILNMLLLFAVISALFGFNPAPVQAHMNTIGYSDITITGHTIKYALYLDPAEVDQWLDTRIRKTFVLDPNKPQNQAEQRNNRDLGELDMLVTSSLSVKNNGSLGMLTITDVKPEKRSENEFVRIDLTASFENPVQNYELQYNFFFDSIDPKHQNFANIKVEGAEMTQVLKSDGRVIAGNTGAEAQLASDDTIQMKVPKWLATLWTFLVMGAEHIWTGYDHLLFLLGLVILKQNKWDYVKMLTAFTVGHSITLALSSLNLVSISFSIIEPLIALSIVYVAVENVWLKRPHWRWGVAVLFGLIHGFGFSDILRGTLGDRVALSLFSFNLGVEIGQLTVLAVLLPLLWMLGRMKWYPRVVFSVSSVIGILGIFWFVERIIGGK